MGESKKKSETKCNSDPGIAKHPASENSGQEWILDAYRALEPRVSLNRCIFYLFFPVESFGVSFSKVPWSDEICRALKLRFVHCKKTTLVCSQTKNYVREFTSQNVRPDGRPFRVFRPITVLTSVLTRNSYGSAMVTLGSKNSATTRVIAACTLLVGHPGPATPTHGDIDVLLSASPLTGPRFDLLGREIMDSAVATHNYHCNYTNMNGNYELPQPTDIKEIESWIRRTIRSSRFIDPQQLGIEPGKSAWRVRISINVLNHDGNIWDAALLCACAALIDLKLPVVEIDRRDGGVKIVTSGEGSDSGNVSNDTNEKVKRKQGRSLTLGPLPVPLTVAILPNSSNKNITNNRKSTQAQILLVDPTGLEEDVASGNIATIVCNTKNEIIEFHKKGSASRLSIEQVAAIASMGFGRARDAEPSFIVGR